MRRTVVVDDTLDGLILERDSVRIQLSLLGEKTTVDAEELAHLRAMASEFYDRIRDRQRTI